MLYMPAFIGLKALAVKDSEGPLQRGPFGFQTKKRPAIYAQRGPLGVSLYITSRLREQSGPKGNHFVFGKADEEKELSDRDVPKGLRSPLGTERKQRALRLYMPPHPFRQTARQRDSEGPLGIYCAASGRIYMPKGASCVPKGERKKETARQRGPFGHILRSGTRA